MTAVTIFALATFSLAMLALSMQRHHRDVFGADTSRVSRSLLRAAGWLLLTASLLAAVFGDAGIGIGLVLWFGTMTITSLSVAAGIAVIVWRKT